MRCAACARIASQLHVDDKGQTLVGKPGERVQFGCSNRIRHTLAPDNSSLTQCQKTASRVATTETDRSYTRIVFVDAVEPKKDISKAATAAQPFPNTIDVSYTLTPVFIASVAPAAALREAEVRDMELPVTTIPAQVRKVVGAGYALSPYKRTHEYSEKRGVGSGIYGSSSRSRFATRTTPASGVCWRTHRTRSWRFQTPISCSSVRTIRPSRSTRS